MGPAKPIMCTGQGDNNKACTLCLQVGLNCDKKADVGTDHTTTKYPVKIKNSLTGK
jgi:hypothetical protein